MFKLIFAFAIFASLNSSVQSLTKEYSSYRPLPLCRPSDFVRYPETIQDVQSIVLEAIARNITVKVFGARHSQTDIICTEGIPVQNIGLKYFQINADQTATFGSGVSLYEANEFLRANNRGLKTTPAFGNITLGGAIGTGSHGSTIKHYSSISSQVISLVVVDGLGKLVQITDEAELRSFRINLGLLGIVVRITLLTQPLYKVIAHNYVTSEDVLTDGIRLSDLSSSFRICVGHSSKMNYMELSYKGPPDGLRRAILGDGGFRGNRGGRGTRGRGGRGGGRGFRGGRGGGGGFNGGRGGAVTKKEKVKISMLFYNPKLQSILVDDVDTPGDAYTNDHVPSTYASFNIFAKAMIELTSTLTESSCEAARKAGFDVLTSVQVVTQKTLTSQVPDFVPIYTEDGKTVLNPAVGYYDKMFAPICSDTSTKMSSLQCLFSHGNVYANITILDNEMSVDLDELPKLINAIKDILSKAPAAFPFQGILLRFSAKSTDFMSTSYGRDSVNFEFYIANRKNMYQKAASGLAAYQAIMQLLARQFSGRSHWGKSGMVYHSSEMLDLKLDPSARAAFIETMNKFDPNEVFINNFGRRLKKTSSKQDLHPAEIHCGIRDNCFCSKNSDCAVTQTCTTFPNSTFRNTKLTTSAATTTTKQPTRERSVSLVPSTSAYAILREPGRETWPPNNLPNLHEQANNQNSSSSQLCSSSPVQHRFSWSEHRPLLPLSHSQKSFIALSTKCFHSDYCLTQPLLLPSSDLISPSFITIEKDGKV
ncbi:L-gulonolactone oxidase [Folsomia candida]|uniref:L-gulonolactone oxidase n=1 Tax=Folsomia candida TaxID=158441 RepID=A0A226ESZ8_FOLCA|nr:L-gulonolactone oxidase [Folsomia candida]